MYFQILDNEERCTQAFLGGELQDYSPSREGTTYSKTWKHTAHILDPDLVSYGYVRSSGKPLDSFCPEYMQNSWQKVSSRIKAIMKSVSLSKCDVLNNCIYDFVPSKFLTEFLEAKEVIIREIFNSFPEPPHVEILKKAHILTEFMNSKKYTFDNKLVNTNYNIFGTKTGRLSNPSSSLPILTMKKEKRELLKPNHDLFVELDFNGAEIRALLSLLGREQPIVDIHDWNMQNVFADEPSRESAKLRFFAWLYNPAAEDRSLDLEYDRNSLISKFWDGSLVKTPFARELAVDKRRALNYLLQSTSSDICIEQSYKVYEKLANCKSNICFLMHDSVIIDYAKEDKHLLSEIVDIFSSTRFGKYKTNVSAGKNLGQLRRL